MPEMTPRQVLEESLYYERIDYEMGYITPGKYHRTVAALEDAYTLRVRYLAAQKGAGDAATEGH